MTKNTFWVLKHILAWIRICLLSRKTENSVEWCTEMALHYKENTTTHRAKLTEIWWVSNLPDLSNVPHSPQNTYFWYNGWMHAARFCQQDAIWPSLSPGTVINPILLTYVSPSTLYVATVAGVSLALCPGLVNGPSSGLLVPSGHINVFVFHGVAKFCSVFWNQNRNLSEICSVFALGRVGISVIAFCSLRVSEIIWCW